MDYTFDSRIRNIQDNITRNKILKEQNKQILLECKESLSSIINSDPSFIAIINSIDPLLTDKDYLDKVDSMNYKEAMELKERINKVIGEILDKVEGSLQ